jgi:hypothetical protein
MARPGHMGDHDAVLAAPDARCRLLHQEPGAAQIEATPPAAPIALIVEWATPTADPTPLPLAAFRGAHAPVGFADQVLQHNVFHTENPEP